MFKNSYNIGKRNGNFKYDILTKDFLITKYIINKEPATKIAREVGCGNDIIYYYLKKYNIKIQHNKKWSKILTKEFLMKEYKKNNLLINLISLCRNCHMKTNSNRKYWKKKFKKQVNTSVVQLEV